VSPQKGWRKTGKAGVLIAAFFKELNVDPDIDAGHAENG
jgi:hypothetical protein